MISSETQERVRIIAHFQGEVKHQSLSLSLGCITIKLPGSDTKITLSPPNESVHGRFLPLKFSVRKKGELRTQELEGLRLTAENANTFAMSVYIFEPGPKVGPRVLQPDGTIWQQETVTRSEREVPVIRSMEIEPGANYRLEIMAQGGWKAEARLVKIEGSVQESKAMGADSKLFQSIYPSISGLLCMKFAESKMRVMASPRHSSSIIFKSEFNGELAKKSVLTAINKLHSDLRSELEEMCKTAQATNNISLGEKALGRFLLALTRTDISGLLEDQLKAVVDDQQYPFLLAFLYDDVIVRIIDIFVNNAKKYVGS